MLNFYISIFLLSASIISYEILLMRLFSIAQWHHFAYMIISLALLGFGASGTAIALLQKWLMRYFEHAYSLCCLIFAFAVVLCFLVVQDVPFNPFMILWDWHQYIHLLENYLILFVPFFFGASCIGMALMRFKEHINRLYFFDLFGAGSGALAIVLALYFVAPEDNLLFTSGLGFLAAFAANVKVGQTGKAEELPSSLPAEQPPKHLTFQQCPPSEEVEREQAASLATRFTRYIKTGRFIRASVTALLALIFFVYFGTFYDIELDISEYKGLSSALNFPDAEILDEKSSPLGIIHVLKSAAIRYVPGLSLAYGEAPPPQIALFSDADSMSAITNFNGDIAKLKYLDYTSSALPYHLKKGPKTLILGAGGGADVLCAIYHQAESIDAVELNPQVVELVEGKHGDFAHHIYREKNSWNVQVRIAEARGYVRRTKEHYDVIQVALLDSLGASAAGVHALSESYLYTSEALQEFLARLNEGGILAITRWLKVPPRDTIKLFATAVEALEKTKGAEPAQQLAFIRSWRTGTLLVKKGPFTEAEIKAIRAFCEERSYDIAYYPGIKESEANRYNVLAQPEYFRYTTEILFGDRKQFYDDYVFNVKPSTDDKPYFFHFFKWQSLPLFIDKMREGWLPFIEWGYIILIATLIQATIASVILILLPLCAIRQPKECGNPPLPPLSQKGEGEISATEGKNKTSETHRVRIFIYFLALGLGFMFIEMAFIQKFILLLSYPTYAIAVVLCSFLVFAGCGSLFSSHLCLHLGKSRRNLQPADMAILAIVILSLLYLVFLGGLFNLFIPFTDAVKIPVAIMLIAPLAFFMGMPFPLGLKQVSETIPALIPWAWGINGCASVISSVLATCLAISYGFSFVVIIAACLYGIAAVAYR